ncbi:MAG TPA: DUF6498-containing protein [Candidatus Kapabacteria bacterium]|nr:DUF6498-containing protein [Candidatus Kapabacteria bacterium]
MKKFHYLDIIITSLFTIFAVFQGQLTIFYILYLFWWQEVALTVVDLFIVLKKKNSAVSTLMILKQVYANFFLLSVYFVFIVVLFGLFINFGNGEILAKNIRIFFFRNIYFNANVLIFTSYYIYIKYKDLNKQGAAYTPIVPQAFSPRQIVLHVSLIFGAIMQSIGIQNFAFNSAIANVLAILPFLLIKIIFSKRISIKPNLSETTI